MATKKPIPIMIPAPEVKLIDRIYENIKLNAQKPIRLSRLGASGIGDSCLRKIWLSWRAYDVSDFDGRMLRLFNTGHLQEQRIVDDLIQAGCQVWAVDASRWRVDSCMARTAGQGMPLGASLCSEQSSQNWSGQGESDCLIKTKHCDGLKRC